MKTLVTVVVIFDIFASIKVMRFKITRFIKALYNGFMSQLIITEKETFNLQRNETYR